MNTFEFFIGLLFSILISSTRSQRLNFTNPILDRNSADPCVLHLGDSYYLTLSENRETELTIFKSPILTSFRNAEKKVAFRTPPGYSDLWASEMHIVDGELYIYFTMRNTTTDHRMYVIKAENASNPMGNWSSETKLLTDWDFAAIDATVMNHNNRLYFLWASWATGPLKIYIAPMHSATSVASPKIILKEPTEEWECHDGCVNEGPFFIYNKNVSYMIFSVSSTWGPNYALSQMSIEAGKDPMNVSNWESTPGPVFSRNDEEDVYTTGHAAFTTSPDWTETWMVYHGTSNTTHIDGYRIARIEKIDWNEDGSPSFPRPHGYNHPQPVPSGQTSV